MSESKLINMERIEYATAGRAFTRVIALVIALVSATGCTTRTTVTYEPVQVTPTAPAAAMVAPDRTSPPGLEPVPQLRLPQIQRFTLSNGMNVLLMEKHDLPLVQANLVIDAGNVNDPADHVGLASLTADMLDEGAAGRKALDIASALELLGARFSVESGTHSANASLHVPVAQLQPALRIVSEILLRPDFPEAELDRLRRERTTGLVRAHDSPGAVGGALASQTLFGREHAYGRATTAASLQNMTIPDVRQFYEKYWRPNTTTAIVVGDVSMAAARAALESAFGGWKSQPVTTASVQNAAQVQGRRIYIVDKPGAAQSVMMLGRIGVARETADYFPLQVMNTILGASFTSRLNQNLREKHGYAYGASSSFDYRLAAGPFMAQSNVQTQSTGPALGEFMNELRRIREDVTTEEVERARNNLAMSYAPGFQSVAGIAGRLAELVVYRLPQDYFNQYTSRVLAVTKSDVDRVAKQYIDPDNITVFIVGDRAKIEPQVKALNLGEITFLTITDVLGPVPTVK